MGLVRLDPEVMELDLGLRPGEGRGPLEGGRLAVLVGQVEDLVARLRDDGGEDRVGGRAGGEPDPAPEAEDRVQHRPDRVRQRAAVDDRDRRADRPAPAEEPGAIRLVLDDPAGLASSTAATCAAQIGLSSAGSSAGGSPAARR